MKYYKLTILKEVKGHKSPCGQTSKKVLCKCDCGGEKVVMLNNLKRGIVKSCGKCYFVDDSHKICKICGKVKPLDEFFKVTTGSGRTGGCKVCKKRKKSKEIGLRDTKKYALRHPDKIKEKWAKYYEANKGKIAAHNKKKRSTEEWKTKNALWRVSNIDKIRKTRKRWRKNMPTKSKLKNSLRHRFYKIIVRLKKGIKYTNVINLVGCSIDQLKIHLELQFTEGMNWSNYGFGKDKWTIDHILPLDYFNLFNLEEQKKAFHYTNLQPLWGVDNFKKSNKVA